MDLKKMKVTDLRSELEKRELLTTGLKGDLVNRLQARLDEEEFGLVDAPAGEGETAVNATSATIASTTLAENAIEEKEKEKEKERVISSKSAASGEGNIVTSVENEDGKKSAETTASTAGKKTNLSEKKSTEDSKTGAIPTENSSKSEKAMTFAEKKKARAERFGIETEENVLEKKLARAKRFGIVTKETEEEKKKDRAKRFGLDVKDNSKNKKQKKGLPGVQKPVTSISSAEAEKRLARAKRFGTTSKTTEELKAALRKERFAAST